MDLRWTKLSTPTVDSKLPYGSSLEQKLSTTPELQLQLLFAEKLQRIQVILQWMILKYTPEEFTGITGHFLYQYIRTLCLTNLQSTFIEHQNINEPGIFAIIIDYLYFGS